MAGRVTPCREGAWETGGSLGDGRERRGQIIIEDFAVQCCTPWRKPHSLHLPVPVCVYFVLYIVSHMLVCVSTTIVKMPERTLPRLKRWSL